MIILQIISQKDNSYTFDEFMDNSVKQKYLDGIYFDVTETKDNQIVLFNSVLNNEASIKNIQSTSYSSLLKTEVVTLEQLLSRLNNTWEKRVMLNLIPLITPALNEQNIAEVTKRNEQYVDKVIGILENYKALDIKLSTESISLLYFLRKKATLRELGIVLNPQSLGYIDVDFYIVKPLMFDGKILEEQLKRGKEVIFQLNNLYDINYLVSNEFQKGLEDCTKEEKNMMKKITFLSSYPELIYKSFQDKM